MYSRADTVNVCLVDVVSHVRISDWGVGKVGVVSISLVKLGRYGSVVPILKEGPL